MDSHIDLLKNLLAVPGLSGHEGPARRLIEAAWRPLADEVSLSRLGSLHALRRGSLPQPRPSLLLAAHMDAIGLMVSRRVGEFLYLSAVGGIDVRNLPGQRVTVHGRRDLPGVIALPPAHLLPEGAGKGIELEHLVLDTGLPEAELAGLVRTGDLVSYAQPPLELNGDLLVGHSLDNRVSVAAVTHALELLRGRSLEWDVWAAATVQEEVGLIGAGTSAFQLRPSLAIAVDATWGSGPGSPGHKTFAVGKGITLGWGPSVHPGVFKAVKEVADRLELPYKLEAMPTSSGTDADRMQLAAEGLPTMVVSIPLRYMHSPVEMAALKDIARAGRLLAEFAAGLDGGFMGRLSLEE